MIPEEKKKKKKEDARITITEADWDGPKDVRLDQVVDYIKALAIPKPYMKVYR